MNDSPQPNTSHLQLSSPSTSSIGSYLTSESLVSNFMQYQHQQGDSANPNYIGTTSQHSSSFKLNFSMELLSRLNQMRGDPKLCDYEIRVNGITLNVHKFILIAVSDFFKCMLTGEMRESKENFVELKGFSTSIGIEAMINFAYTGFLSITFENVIYLLDAASHLQIRDAIRVCSNYLIANISQTNCVNILKIADMFALSEVNTSSNEYLGKHFVQIYQENIDQFMQLSHEQLINQLKSECIDMCSELDLFLMIVKWLNGEKSRLNYAPHIVKHIRFMTMSAYEIADFVEPVDFMRENAECYQMLIDAYRYHSLSKRQPLVCSDQSKLRIKKTLVAVGEANIFVLNETKQQWEVMCSAPLEDNYPYPFAAITINNYLYVLGMRKSASEEYRTCYRFSPRTLEWTQLASLLHDRSRFCASVVGGYIYAFGGFEGFKKSNRVYLNSIERYSIENDKWEEFSHEGPQVSSMAACTFDGLIYFGGGKNINWTKVSDFYCINVANKTLEKKTNMLTARTTHQITVNNEQIIMIGGFDDAGNGILSIESYNVKLDQWSLLTNIPGTLSKTWPQSLGVINGKFYISVFHTPNTFKIIQKGYFYDVSTNIWSEAPTVHEKARYCPTCALAFPRNVYNSGDDYHVAVNHDSKAILQKRNEISQSIDETLTTSLPSLCNPLLTDDNSSTDGSSGDLRAPVIIDGEDAVLASLDSELRSSSNVSLM